MAAHVLAGQLAQPGSERGGSPALRRQPASAIQPVSAPPIAHQALSSPGQPLDPATSTFMGPHFNSDLSGVRIHTGAKAAAAAEAVQAKAYTVGQDIVFNTGRYNPGSPEGKRLLAHELSHTVQQSGGSSGAHLSHAPHGVYRDPLPATPKGTSTDTETPKPKTESATVQLSPFWTQQLQLWLSPPQLSPAPATPFNATGPSLSQQPLQYAPISPPLLPPVPKYNLTPPALAPTATAAPSLAPPSQSGTSAAPGAAPKAPDRVSFFDIGKLSIGARIGFPDLSKESKPGDPPNALQETLKKGEALNFIFNKTPPSEYQLDPAKLVGAMWGIFATQIDPSLANKIAFGLASKGKAGGIKYELVSHMD